MHITKYVTPWKIPVKLKYFLKKTYRTAITVVVTGRSYFYINRRSLRKTI